MNRRFLRVPAVDWCWLLALGLVRVLIGFHYGLGVDEAHYALYGTHLDWSYLDHPALVGWLQALFINLLGHHDSVVHLPAEILGVIAGAQAFRLGDKLTNNTTAARWGAIALSVSFLPNGLWFMLVPDTILLVLIFWLIEIVMRLHERNYRRLRDWCAFGIALGLCGLTKYTAVILLPGLVGFFLCERFFTKNPVGTNRLNWRKFFYGFLSAVVLAAVVVAPVFYWNLTHQWISFQYQITHVMHANPVKFSQRLHNLAAFLIVQFVAYSPFVIAATALGWIARRAEASATTPVHAHSDTRARLILWLALPCLLFFAYSGSRETGLPHWTFYAWGLLLPAGVSLGVAQIKVNRTRLVRWIKILVSISGVLFAMVNFELAFHIIRYPAFRSPYNDFAGWHELHPILQNILTHENNRAVAIAVPNWTLGSRANWYFADLAPVYVLQDKIDQFKLWEKTPPTEKDMLILEWRGFSLNAAQKSQCTSIEPLMSKTFYEHKTPVTSVALWWCRNYGHRVDSNKNTDPAVTK